MRQLRPAFEGVSTAGGPVGNRYPLNWISSSTNVDDEGRCGYGGDVDIEASARKHGVPEEDMLHALRHHWRAFETDDPAVTMFIGPSRAAEPLEVGVVSDEEGTAVIHAMRTRRKFLEGWWIE